MIPLIGLTIVLALGTVGVVTAFALTNDGGSDNPQVPNGGDTAGEVLHGDPTYEEWLSKYKPTPGPVTSIDEIDPNVCNLVHNINVCTPEELEDAFRVLTDIASVETHGRTEPDVGEVVVTIIDDIDPNVCDYIHNINACTPEELEELGNLAAISWVVDPETELEGEPEPLFVDGEPQYEVQSYEEAVEQDCGLAGGTFYVTSDGEVGCVVAHDLKDSGEELVSSSQPPTVEPLPVLAPATQ